MKEIIDELNNFKNELQNPVVDVVQKTLSAITCLGVICIFIFLISMDRDIAILNRGQRTAELQIVELRRSLKNIYAKTDFIQIESDAKLKPIIRDLYEFERILQKTNRSVERLKIDVDRHDKYIKSIEKKNK